MEVNANLVKELREKTGAGVMDCKRALAEAAGDFEKAVVWLREKGIAAAAKRAGRVASEGAIGSYIHAGGKLGVLLEKRRLGARMQDALPRVGFIRPDQDPQERRLACPIGPDQTDPFARVDFERHSVENRSRVELPDDVVD